MDYLLTTPHHGWEGNGLESLICARDCPRHIQTHSSPMEETQLLLLFYRWDMRYNWLVDILSVGKDLARHSGSMANVPNNFTRLFYDGMLGTDVSGSKQAIPIMPTSKRLICYNHISPTEVDNCPCSAQPQGWDCSGTGQRWLRMPFHTWLEK